MNSYSLLVFVPVQYSGKHIRCQFTDSGPWTKTRYFRIVYVKHLIFGPKWFMSILRGHVKIWHDVLNSWLLAQDKLPLNLCLFSREFPMFEERTFFLVFRNLLPLYFTTYAWCCESFKVYTSDFYVGDEHHSRIYHSEFREEVIAFGTFALSFGSRWPKWKEHCFP